MPKVVAIIVFTRSLTTWASSSDGWPSMTTWADSACTSLDRLHACRSCTDSTPSTAAMAATTDCGSRPAGLDSNSTSVVSRNSFTA